MNNKSAWDGLSFFISSTHSQKYLAACYQTLEVSEWEKRAYENCFPFIYYLEHGKNYYTLAEHAPLSIQPVLLFYGMIQLLKACLLTVDPNYPESTILLAHGVTTRKRKKQDYSFLHDEVKIQKHGLFTHAADKLFHIKYIEGDKYTMDMLMHRIAELYELFFYSKKETKLLKVGVQNQRIISIPVAVLDLYHMTDVRFQEYIKSTCSHLKLVPANLQNSEEILFETSIAWDGLRSSPLLYNYNEDAYFLPPSREMMTIFPEVLSHYLLLYNLSMISRYETEWWSELLRSYHSEDYPFIFQFLSISAKKIPYYVYLYLINKIQG
ncbi:YaaC family protein [Ectobacillus sp. sgz5001026]|uniref:YaaC family protein n=1 Tax=Ectobacillus sp. sgz5001026 TaxID=3242473 RepID=UPI0036D395B1